MRDAFIGVDWGTTNRRAFLIDRGAVSRSWHDDCGAASIASADYPPAVASLRARLGDLPMLLAGMAGSNIGWHQVPYVATPAGLDTLARGALHVDARTVILPGVADIGCDRADVMRGEEVLMLGAVASGAVPGDALLCQPGTHCKWAEIKAGRITRFTTAMTGELFALLRRDGLLARQLGGQVQMGVAFRDGVAEGARRDLTASLFGIRSYGLLRRRDDADAASFASGLLIGADVAARLQEYPGAMVHLVAGPDLGKLYQTAIEILGASARLVDSDQAFVVGITRLESMTI
ncbi:MAG: 2-dehydro-3-deoxygalactonokinase [Pseudomonadota bacterium]